MYSIECRIYIPINFIRTCRFYLQFSFILLTHYANTLAKCIHNEQLW